MCQDHWIPTLGGENITCWDHWILTLWSENITCRDHWILTLWGENITCRDHWTLTLGVENITCRDHWTLTLGVENITCRDHWTLTLGVENITCRDHCISQLGILLVKSHVLQNTTRIQNLAHAVSQATQHRKSYYYYQCFTHKINPFFFWTPKDKIFIRTEGLYNFKEMLQVFSISLLNSFEKTTIQQFPHMFDFALSFTAQSTLFRSPHAGLLKAPYPVKFQLVLFLNWIKNKRIFYCISELMLATLI